MFSLAAVLGWVLVGMSTLARASAAVPDERVRVAMFDRVVEQIERIDGEGLRARTNRPETWERTIARLRAEIRGASTPLDIGQVFRRLSATYPNLHAQVTLEPAYALTEDGSRPKLGARFFPEKISKGQKRFVYRISGVEPDLIGKLNESERPALGDELIQINGVAMEKWSRENFLFCKMPMREQCEAELSSNLRKELLGWDRRIPLSYTLKRGKRTWSVRIPVEAPSRKGEPRGALQPEPEKSSVENDQECPVELDRYEGFKPVLRGNQICVFESPGKPGVAVLRIVSFAYRDLPEGAKIKSLQDEVDRFHDQYWKKKAPRTRKLIIDLIDNGGGDTPVAWYRLFLAKPFQEQYVQFKKLPELDDPEIRKRLFYGDSGHEIWFRDLKRSGQYQKIAMGKFLPATPQFCADESKNCDDSLYEPLAHGFTGQVRILTNQYCISSCTGFVWALKHHLAGRVKVIGFPESGDSAYARLLIDLSLKKDSPGFSVTVSGRQGRTKQEVPEGAVLRQQVTATRTTDSKGRILSAKPTMPDVWGPYRYREREEPWESQVFKAALNN